MPKTAPKYPMYLPRWRAGITSPVIACAPTMRPPAPTPWTALEAMRSPRFCARPESIEPTRKMTIASWKRFFRPYWSPSFPHRGVEIVEAKRYAITTHDRWFSPWRSPAIVGRAVDTIVWSSEARIMPNMSATRTTRIRRCSAWSDSWAGSCLGSTELSRATSVLHVVLQGRREPAEERPEPGQVRFVPTLEESLQPRSPCLQHPLQCPPTCRRQADARRASVIGIGMADDQPVSLELLDLAGHGRGVDIEHLGQRRHSDGVAVDMQLVEGCRTGPVQPDPGRLQQAFVHAHLADRAGHDLQARLDLVDSRHGCRRAGPAGAGWATQCVYLRHVTIMAPGSSVGNVAPGKATPGKGPRRTVDGGSPRLGLGVRCRPEREEAGVRTAPHSRPPRRALSENRETVGPDRTDALSRLAPSLTVRQLPKGAQ